MTNRQHHFSIGVVNVSLRSARRIFVDEYKSLYRPYCRGSANNNTIEVEIQTRHRYPWRRGPYTIHSEDMKEFVVQRRDEVLPYLEWMINWQIIHTYHQHVLLHASSLALGGNAMILPGDPGSGKTTLTAGLLARGWSYLCDEFALIEPTSRMIQPFPRALCIKEASFPVVERLGLPLRRKTSYRKATKGRVAFLNPLDISPDIVGKPAPIRWVVFPRYVADATPSLEPITRSQAVYDLARQCFNFAVHQENAVNVLARIVRSADCYRLTAGDIRATCDLVESLARPNTIRKAG